MNGVEINVDTLLFEIDFLSDETNCEIFLIIQRYIPHIQFGFEIKLVLHKSSFNELHVFFILVCNKLRYLLPHEKCADFFTF
jgi:hypothetical protein